MTVIPGLCLTLRELLKMVEPAICRQDFVRLLLLLPSARQPQQLLLSFPFFCNQDELKIIDNDVPSSLSAVNIALSDQTAL